MKAARKVVMYENAVNCIMSTLLESIKNIIDIHDFTEAQKKGLSNALRYGDAYTLYFTCAYTLSNVHMQYEGFPLIIRLRRHKEYAVSGDFEMFMVYEGFKKPFKYPKLSHRINRRIIWQLMVRQISTPVYTYLPNSSTGKYGAFATHYRESLSLAEFMIVEESVQDGSIWGPKRLTPAEQQIFLGYTIYTKQRERSMQLALR